MGIIGLINNYPHLSLSMKLKESQVQLGHGGGGIMQEELIQFLTQGIKNRKIGAGIGLDGFDDGAAIPWDFEDSECIVTADGHTVNPIIFPGGDLGKLSICGTINDLIMMGATPLALTSTYFIEEGLKQEKLELIANSFNTYAAKAQIAVLAGDTKVMPKGTLNEIILSTSGIGIRPKNRQIHDGNCKIGAKIILTGSIGDHGAALIAKREGIDLQTTLQSDVSLLSPLLPIIEKYPEILAMKDPTRGGLATALKEWATKSKVSVWIKETKIPIKKEVQAIANILGLDPLEIANEGKAILCVQADKAQAILDEIQQTEIGKEAVILGEIREDNPGMVVLETELGGTRLIEKPMGELIPRIC